MEETKIATVGFGLGKLNDQLGGTGGFRFFSFTKFFFWDTRKDVNR